MITARAVAALLASGALLASSAQADLAMRNGWVAETPPAALATAAFGTLANDGDQTVVIVGATSPSCERVDIHRTIDRGGVAHMERVDRLEIAPGGQRVFEPNGMHWMLIRPAEIASGEQVVLRLEHADGSSTELKLPVRRHGERDAHAHAHH